LQKDPARRFASMGAFAQELRSCLAALDTEGATLIIPASAAPRRATRRAFPVGYLILGLAVAAAALAAALLLGGASHRGGKGGAGAGGGSGVVVHLRGTTTYDPQGDGSELVLGQRTAPLATDSSTATTWKTEIYATPEFGKLKDGLGLVLSSGGATKLASVTVTTPTPGFVARIEVGNSPSGPFAVDSATQTVSGATTFSLDGKSGSYWVVWLTQLGPERTAQISEVTARR
jgi:hypothetical protein